MGRAKVSTVIRVNKASAKVGDVFQTVMHFILMKCRLLFLIYQRYFDYAHGTIFMFILFPPSSDEASRHQWRERVGAGAVLSHVCNSTVPLSFHSPLVLYCLLLTIPTEQNFIPAIFIALFEVWIRALVLGIAAARCHGSHLYFWSMGARSKSIRSSRSELAIKYIWG